MYIAQATIFLEHKQTDKQTQTQLHPTHTSDGQKFQRMKNCTDDRQPMTSYSKPVVTIWIYIASFLPHDAMLALCVLWPCVAHMSNQQPIPTACREVSLRGEAGSCYHFCRNFLSALQCTAHDAAYWCTCSVICLSVCVLASSVSSAKTAN